MPSSRRNGPALGLLVRHGRTSTTGKVLPGRAPGLHLSEHGTQQANAAAERIAQLRRLPVAVYSSPLERAVETARPIATALDLRVRVDKGLTECDFGNWTGAQLGTLRRKREWKAVQQLPSSFRFPDGESFSEMQARIVETIDKLSERHQGDTFVAVSHADPIKAAVAATSGVPLDLFQRIVISPCSITAMVRSTSGYAIVCVNSTASLTELALS